MRLRIASVICYALMAAGIVRADALPASAIPADARWVMHLDMDAVRNTPLWEMFQKKFVEPQKEYFTGRKKLVEAATGANMEKDLHGLTLFGTAFDETSACLLLHVPMDQQRVTTLLKENPEFRSTEHNGHTIMSWRDQGRLLYGSFAAGDMVLVGRSNKMVALVLDTIDGKSPALKNERLLPVAATTMDGGEKVAPLWWLAATDVADLPRTQKVDSPLLAQIDTASLAVGATRERVTIRAAVLAKSEKSAQLLMAAADGVKAMLALAAADERANPQVRTLGSAMQNLTLAMDAKDVSATWSVEMEKLDAMLAVVRVEPRSTTGPATTAKTLIDITH